MDITLLLYQHTCCGGQTIVCALTLQLTQQTLLLARELRRVCLGLSFGLYLNLRALCEHVLFGFVLAAWRSAPSFRL